MFKIKHSRIINIVQIPIMALLIVCCSKDQNTFLPDTPINLSVSLVNYNHLKISGNSILFTQYGYSGVIISCVNPELNMYNAFDACCPYEEDHSGTIEIESISGLTTPPGTIYSSGFFGVCDKCGSEFNLMGNGEPTKGPATKYLQRYTIIVSSNNVTVKN